MKHLATLGWQSCSSTGRRFGGVGGCDLRLRRRVGVVLSDSSASRDLRLLDHHYNPSCVWVIVNTTTDDIDSCGFETEEMEPHTCFPVLCLSSGDTTMHYSLRCKRSCLSRLFC